MALMVNVLSLLEDVIVESQTCFKIVEISTSCVNCIVN
jgi:hypothetical protein